VRVPAIVISPLIPRNLIDHTLYDHSSLLATVEKLLGLKPLTQRDGQANDLLHLFSLSAVPRRDAPTTLPEPADSGFHCDDDMVASSAAGTSISGLKEGERPSHAAEKAVPKNLGAFCE